jgi:hypothetical protein
VRRACAAVVAVLFVAASGCGSSGDSTVAPIACTIGTQGYLSSLRAAPGEVLLGKQTPISECLVENQGAGDLAAVGQKLVAAASELNKQSLRDPGGPATVQLGYLVGAIEQGSATTGGIHQDLVRRLESAANFNPGRGGTPAAFESAYDKGYAAGQETG